MSTIVHGSKKKLGKKNWKQWAPPSAWNFGKKTEKCALFRTPCTNLFHWRTTKERIKRNKKNQKKGAKKKKKQTTSRTYSALHMSSAQVSDAMQKPSEPFGPRSCMRPITNGRKPLGSRTCGWHVCAYMVMYERERERAVLGTISSM